MRTFSLASGSSGNSFFIESSSGKRFLVDAGLSFSRTREILEQRGIDIESLDGIFITHEHGDHTLGLPLMVKNLQSKFYMSKGTYQEIGIDIENIVFIKNHDSFDFGGIRVFAVSKSHDAREALSFVFDDGVKLGVFTDLGRVSDEILHIIKTLDIVYFEANYCEEKLREVSGSLSSNYLTRLVSDLGHLGLSQTCEALKLASFDSQKIILTHISSNTNSYERAYTKVREALLEVSKFPEIFVSFQGEPSDWFE